ncbi:ac52 [Lambdina fiscellaria nucleopolyhedrovirus]|uniref:Ac52 n=1 Tax=Lambdina fiscellaria nucleopolyhedrovirus TaxID=1642929 RepID=A0A0E3Z8B6_9ABAC|nr:ac52 [Lambdina fiscellaria nucleopolyhedrovirus]AKC91726.1 ac52 [Lambdina fiscellaria nucleopolyhedrovirus]
MSIIKIVGRLPSGFSYARNMELILPFVEYSKRYRNCANEQRKHKIYTRWLAETRRRCKDSNDNGACCRKFTKVVSFKKLLDNESERLNSQSKRYNKSVDNNDNNDDGNDGDDDDGDDDDGDDDDGDDDDGDDDDGNDNYENDEDKDSGIDDDGGETLKRGTTNFYKNSCDAKNTMKYKKINDSNVDRASDVVNCAIDVVECNLADYKVDAVDNANRVLHELCDFCFRRNIDRREACIYCLFPLNLSSAAECELGTYVLLSVCYWEQQGEVDADANCFVVWKERMRVAWLLNNDANVAQKTYTFTSLPNLRCVQCRHAVVVPLSLCKKQNRISNKDFTFNLFCKICLFPLFAIKYKQIDTVF